MSQKIIFTYYNGNITNSTIGNNLVTKKINFFNLNSLQNSVLLDLYITLTLKSNTTPNPENNDFELCLLFDNANNNGNFGEPIFFFHTLFSKDELKDELASFGYKEKTFRINNLILKKNETRKLSFLIRSKYTLQQNIQFFGISIIGLGYEQEFLQTQQIQIEQEDPQLFVSNNEPEDPNINDIWIQV